ncbi:MAG: CehA/McbA family metallohydrolase, partial [Planctomycetota bacterium]
PLREAFLVSFNIPISGAHLPRPRLEKELVPVIDVDLFELANNHIWRTEFFFKSWTGEMRPRDWNIETDQEGFTEWGWIDFGFKSYYSLLNCGFKMRPTAGTASGVHPVPLGYGRVYVECPEGFTYDDWIRNLDAGRSFVTTGPMLFAKVDGQPLGSTIELAEPTVVRVQGSVEGIHACKRIEIVKNGRVVAVVDPENVYESPWIHRSQFDVDVPIDGDSWIAVRCFEPHRSSPPWKMGFAHTAPVHINLPGRPLQPRKIETDYFVRRMDAEIERNRDLLRPEELAEYEQARDTYRQLAKMAVDDRAVTDADMQALAIPSDQLPPGWHYTDIAQTEWKELGANPRLISRPDVLSCSPWFSRDSGKLGRFNILRVYLALYRHETTDRFAILNAYACADDASARRTLARIRDGSKIDAQSRTWRRDDLVVHLALSKELSQAEVEPFASLLESRLPKRGTSSR